MHEGNTAVTGHGHVPRTLERPLVFVDIETNGLSSQRGRVIEVAAIRVEQGRITRVFNQLIDPGVELPAFITRLTGIRSEDLRGARPFTAIAAELHDVLSGAVFVAHNVRFDYSFLKQEFKRAGMTFLPRQLCTVKLSRALYPEQSSHKLAALIERHGFRADHRHRAYDDALVLWQFLQHVYQNFPADTVETAVARQLRQPALPKGVSAELVRDLPQTPGVYIFEDSQGNPLYIGKSINIKQRVLSHFGHDHDDSKEFKISQAVKHISTRTTGGELEALLLESQLVKELLPLHNRRLRRTQRLLTARSSRDARGYLHISLQEATELRADDSGDIMAVYSRRSQARTSLESLLRTYDLCPKLMGLEKSSGACFLRQLHRCRGACVGQEPPELYNQRLSTAFERQRIHAWPYGGPVLVRERSAAASDGRETAIILDQWCVLGYVRREEYCDPQVQAAPDAAAPRFDLDTYKILQQYLTTKLHALSIQPLSAPQLAQFGL